MSDPVVELIHDLLVASVGDTAETIVLNLLANAQTLTNRINSNAKLRAGAPCESSGAHLARTAALTGDRVTDPIFLGLQAIEHRIIASLIWVASRSRSRSRRSRGSRARRSPRSFDLAQLLRSRQALKLLVFFPTPPARTRAWINRV
jgi:hypothetical protein